MHIELPIADMARCSADTSFLVEMETLYAELDREIAARNPRCTNRGACCRFAAFGHHLFVTSVELAYFLARADGPLLVPVDRSYCPYQRGGRCEARTARPAGCRIFFCDPESQDWQGDTTERTLRRLEALGSRFSLPYAYLEWTDALRQLGGRVVQAANEGVQIPFGTAM